MKSPRIFALIPAAGVGARSGVAIPKQYVALGGKPMLRHVLETFSCASVVDHVFVVVSEQDAYIEEIVVGLRDCTVLRHGGATRHASVLNGLIAARDEIADDDWVMVHDAARPGLTVALVDRLVAALKDDEVGGLLALPLVDTIKRSVDGRAAATVPRDGLWAAQTPQMFRYGLLRRALESAVSVTDEASAIEALGLQPKLVEGSAHNFKVTLAQDFQLAEMYLK